MASGLLPKSPVSSSLCDEVPHIFIPKSHLEPREFLISSAKRLLQQYRHKADIRGSATFCPLLDKSGHAGACRHLLTIVPNIGREFPVSSDLLPHHNILAGDFLRGRTFGFQTKGPNFPRREPAEPLDVDGCDLRIADLLRHAF